MQGVEPEQLMALSYRQFQMERALPALEAQVARLEVRARPPDEHAAVPACLPAGRPACRPAGWGLPQPASPLPAWARCLCPSLLPGPAPSLLPSCLPSAPCRRSVTGCR